MSLEGGSVSACQGNIDKVMPGVEVAERGGHVDREVVPLQAVLLCRAPHAADLVLAAVVDGTGQSS